VRGERSNVCSKLNDSEYSLSFFRRGGSWRITPNAVLIFRTFLTFFRHSLLIYYSNKHDKI